MPGDGTATHATGDPLVAALARAVGSDHVLVDDDVRRGYETDWMGRRLGACRAVARPASATEVAAVLTACAAAGASVVPQGGNTGLVGGGVPRGGEVVLSTRRLVGVGPVDRLAAQVAIAAGTTLAAVAEAVAPAGFEVPLDLTARDSATVGGMVATDAGGTRVLRHGSMRANLAGLEAVLADGTVVRRMGGLAKDNAGYHLPGLVCGSEGTLAVVTEVLLRLVPAARTRVTAVVGTASLAASLALVAAVRRALPELDAAEVVFADGVRLTAELLGVTSPLRSAPPCELLLEATSERDDAGALVARLAEVVEAHDPDAETAIAEDPEARRRLWAVRERHSEVAGLLGEPHKLDVSVPLGELAAFEADVRAALARGLPGCVPVLFGHLGDGGMHVNVAVPGGTGREPSGTQPGGGGGTQPGGGTEPGGGTQPGGGDSPGTDDVAAVVFPVVAAHGGSISAEHGVGTDKVRWLSLARTPGEIAAMRRVKDALDPSSVLNPGVVLPHRPRA